MPARQDEDTGQINRAVLTSWSPSITREGTEGTEVARTCDQKRRRADEAYSF